MTDTLKRDPKSPAPGDNALRPGGPHAVPVDPGITDLDPKYVPIKDEDVHLPEYDGDPYKERRDADKP